MDGTRSRPLTKGFENLRVYRLSEEIADKIWTIVEKWDRFARDTVGRQLVRPADSVGANLAEGTGRGTYQDNRRFVRNSRGSLYETRNWLRRAFTRRLLDKDDVAELRALIDELGPKLNAYLRSIGPTPPSEMTNDDDECPMTNAPDECPMTNAQ